MYQRAAIDITTGHAFDSFFRAERRDPWAAQAVQIFTDLATNHRVVGFPQPTALAAKATDDSLLPSVLADGRHAPWALVEALDVPPADSIELNETMVRSQFLNFASWLRLDPNALFKLRAWLTMHFEEPGVARPHGVTVPVHLVSPFLEELPAEQVSAELGISLERFEYAFDVFVRGIQYNSVCGLVAPYFPHPIREHLGFATEGVTFESQSAWSWGSCLVKLASEAPAFRTPTAVLESIQAIRERTLQGATWYHLAGLTPLQQHDAIRTVAAEAKLPAKLGEPLQKTIERNLKGVGMLGSVGAALSGGSANLLGACVGLLIAAGSFKTAEMPKSYLPGAVSSWKVLKGKLVWPELLKEL